MTTVWVQLANAGDDVDDLVDSVVHVRGDGVAHLQQSDLSLIHI